jgi:hypothetical protein
MKIKYFSGLFLLCSAAAFSSTAAAKSDRSHFDFGPKPEITTSINTYDNQMIEAAQIAESSAHKRSHRHCWRAVKNAMLAANVLNDRPTTKYAKQAGEELEQRFGFKKIEVSDPFDAPIGAILVYGGRGAGHVEIRTADGFVSDVVSVRPSHRPLLGVYVRV